MSSIFRKYLRKTEDVSILGADFDGEMPNITFDQRNILAMGTDSTPFGSNPISITYNFICYIPLQTTNYVDTTNVTVMSLVDDDVLTNRWDPGDMINVTYIDASVYNKTDYLDNYASFSTTGMTETVVNDYYYDNNNGYAGRLTGLSVFAKFLAAFAIDSTSTDLYNQYGQMWKSGVGSAITCINSQTDMPLLYINLNDDTINLYMYITHLWDGTFFIYPEYTYLPPTVIEDMDDINSDTYGSIDFDADDVYEGAFHISLNGGFFPGKLRITAQLRDSHSVDVTSNYGYSPNEFYIRINVNFCGLYTYGQSSETVVGVLEAFRSSSGTEAVTVNVLLNTPASGSAIYLNDSGVPTYKIHLASGFSPGFTPYVCVLSTWANSCYMASYSASSEYVKQRSTAYRSAQTNIWSTNTTSWLATVNTTTSAIDEFDVATSSFGTTPCNYSQLSPTIHVILYGYNGRNN